MAAFLKGITPRTELLPVTLRTELNSLLAGVILVQCLSVVCFADLGFFLFLFYFIFIFNSSPNSCMQLFQSSTNRVEGKQQPTIQFWHHWGHASEATIIFSTTSECGYDLPALVSRGFSNLGDLWKKSNPDIFIHKKGDGWEIEYSPKARLKIKI